MPDFHLPRLRAVGVVALLSAEDGLGGSSWQDRAERAERWTTWGALGARRAVDAELQRIRDQTMVIARDCGFPEKAPREERARFDTEAAILFAGGGLIPDEEALRDDVWAWIATVLLPDVVLWRFSRTESRFRGGVRNTFQRVWTRGAALDRGEGDDRWSLLELLPEDAQVQIFERTGLSGSFRVAKAIAEAWVQSSVETGGSNLEDATRRAILALRASSQVLSLDALPDDLLDLEVGRRFAAALAAGD